MMTNNSNTEDTILVTMDVNNMILITILRIMLALVTVSFMIMVDVVVVDEAEVEMDVLGWDERAEKKLVEGERGEDW
jgi:hypothetical protein